MTYAGLLIEDSVPLLLLLAGQFYPFHDQSVALVKPSPLKKDAKSIKPSSSKQQLSQPVHEGLFCY